MAAARSAVQSGDSSELEKVLVGRQIWVEIPAQQDKGMPGFIAGPYRVLSLRRWLPAGPLEDGQGQREKHLVQLWTDPGGTRTLSVGSIHLKDPGRVAGAKRAAVTRQLQDDDE